VAVYVLSLVKTKAAAVLLGPAGVGLVGLYMSVTAMIAVVMSLGVGSSGVGEIASVAAGGDRNALARTARVLRRLCWLTGVAGWLVTAALSVPLSRWVFQSEDHRYALAILGGLVFCTLVGGGYAALLRGLRHIGDLARINLYSAAAGTVLSIVLYALFREAGIVPALLGSAFVSLLINWLFVRRISLESAPLRWADVSEVSLRMVRLGVAIMWSGFLVTFVEFATKGLITRHLGLDFAGYFQAAWTISGMFAGFILGAMAMDFFPRLCAVADDSEAATKLVNEQTEMGLLLALPGLLATFLFAPELVTVIFSTKFSPAAEILPWLLIGVLGKVAGWPLGFVALAKRKALWFALLETIVYVVQIGAVWWLLQTRGMEGVSMAFALVPLVYIGLYFTLSRRLVNFSWSAGAVRIFAASASLLVLASVIRWQSHGVFLWVASLCLVAFASIYALRGVHARVPPNSKLANVISKIPFSAILLRPLR